MPVVALMKVAVHEPAAEQRTVLHSSVKHYKQQRGNTNMKIRALLVIKDFSETVSVRN